MVFLLYDNEEKFDAIILFFFQGFTYVVDAVRKIFHV